MVYSFVLGLHELLDTKTSTLEATKARINDLESVATRRDMIIADQKRVLKQVKEEYQQKLEVMFSIIVLS